MQRHSTEADCIILNGPGSQSLLFHSTFPCSSLLATYAEMTLKYLFFLYIFFSSNDIRSGEEKCLAAFSEAAVMAE